MGTLVHAEESRGDWLLIAAAGAAANYSKPRRRIGDSANQHFIALDVSRPRSSARLKKPLPGTAARPSRSVLGIGLPVMPALAEGNERLVRIVQHRFAAFKPPA